MRIFIISVVWLCATMAVFAQQYSISAIVQGNSNNLPLAGANVVNLNDNSATITDGKGVFHLISGNPVFIINITYLGYSDLFDTVDARDVSHKVYLMKQETLQANEVVINARSDLLRSPQPGIVTLTAKEIELLPSLMGEPDVISAIKLMPGVQAAGDGNSGFHVRGGEVDQNLVLLNNGVVYNSSHVLGFFSVFNSKVIERVKLIKSGMPASYSDRLSSVLDIKMKTPDMYDFVSDVNIGLISSNAYFSAPIVKSKLAVSLAYRRTYINQTLKPVAKRLIGDEISFYNSSRYHFYDLNLNVAYQPNNKNMIECALFTGTDKYQLTETNFDYKNLLNWGNSLFTAGWRYRFNNRLVYRLNASYSGYLFNFDASNQLVNIKLQSAIKSRLISEQIIWEANSFWTFSAGNNIEFYTFSPSYVDATVQDVDLEIGLNKDYYARSHNYFVEGNLKYRRLGVMIGLRIPNYSQLGPYVQAEDSVTYRKNEKVVSYHYLTPRFAFKFDINNRMALKGSLTKHVQFVHQAPASSVTLPTDIWVYSSSLHPPQESWQYSVGLFFQDNLNDKQLYIDFFYKEMKNMVVLTSGIIDSYTNNIDGNLISGNGQVYGSEIFWQQKLDKLSYTLSYTLSRNLRQYDAINNGKIFPAKADRIHNLNLSLQYKLSKRLDASTTFIYATGNALTLPSSWAFIGGSPIAIQGNYHAFRMPAYHRLDISLNYYFTPKRLETSVLNLSIFNVYNRANPFYIYFEYTGDLSENLSVQPRQVSLFPIVPSVTWRISM